MCSVEYSEGVCVCGVCSEGVCVECVVRVCVECVGGCVVYVMCG